MQIIRKKTLKKLGIFIKRYYPQIILSVLLLIISIVSFKNNTYILSNDNYSPELNPRLSLERYIVSPAWRGYRVLGFASESEQADVFRSLLFSIGDIFLPSWLLGQLFYLISLWVGAWFTGLLVQSMVKRSKLVKYNKWAFLISSLTYITTLWTMWLYYQNMAPYISNFGFLPLVLWAIMFYLDREDRFSAFVLFISSLIFTSTSVIATLFVVDFPFILLFTIFLVWKKKIKFVELIKRISIPILIFLSTQLFWILPFVYYTLSTSGDIISSYINRTITSSIIDLETQSQTSINTLRFYNRNLFEIYNDQYLFSRSEDFQNYDFYKVLGLFPFIFSIIGSIFSIAKKRYKYLILTFVVFVCWFLIKVLNPPFENIFIWIQENIPLFKQVFRWPFSKLGEIFLISLTVLSSFGVIYFVDFLMSFFKKSVWKKVAISSLFLIFLLLPIIYSEYMFEGEIFSQRAQVNIPNNYFELAQYLKQKDPNGRIYYAPPANNNYFREYNWGFWGSQFISYIIPNPVMDMSSAVGSSVGERAMLESLDMFKSGNKESFERFVSKYDIKYVLVDKSLQSKGYTYDIDWSITDKLVSEHNPVWESGDLKLYEVNKSSDVKYVETLKNINTNSNNTFFRLDSKDPQVSLSNTLLENVRTEDNYILGDFDYKGYSQYIESNFTKSDWKQFPTLLKVENNKLIVTPSFPKVLGNNIDLPKKEYTFKGEYIVIGNKVYSYKELKKGITIEDKYSEIENIYYISDSDFTSKDLTSSFINSKGHDCGDNNIVENTSITSKLQTAGFTLEGSAQLPCVYQDLRLGLLQEYILKTSISWDTADQNYPGFCVFGENADTCINQEKFFDNTNLFGTNSTVISNKFSPYEKVTLILYSMNTSKDYSTKTTFNNVTIEYAPIQNTLEKISQTDTFEVQDLYLENGSTYTISIPIIYGNHSYIYKGLDSKNIVWQPNQPDSGNVKFEISGNNGQYQSVQEDYVNQVVNLFNTNKDEQYLMYWNGENISNIPASICLIYSGRDKCWYQDLLYAKQKSSSMTFFGSSEVDSKLNLMFGSSSYVLHTENRLDDFVIMRYPKIWNTLGYNIDKSKEYTNVEADRTFNIASSTFYKKTYDASSDRNTLLTIPQATSDGWIAIGRTSTSFNILPERLRVSVNDWKQGWDISNLPYDSYVVIYWPNLLAYFGYLVIIIEGLYLTIKLFEKGFKYVRK